MTQKAVLFYLTVKHMNNHAQERDISLQISNVIF